MGQHQYLHPRRTMKTPAWMDRSTMGTAGHRQAQMRRPLGHCHSTSPTLASERPDRSLNLRSRQSLCRGPGGIDTQSPPRRKAQSAPPRTSPPLSSPPLAQLKHLPQATQRCHLPQPHSPLDQTPPPMPQAALARKPRDGSGRSGVTKARKERRRSTRRNKRPVPPPPS